MTIKRTSFQCNHSSFPLVKHSLQTHQQDTVIMFVSPLFLLTVASLAISSQAYEIVIVNESTEKIIPRVQSLGSPGDAPDEAGFLNPQFERIYDNTNPWLNHPSMAVKEGDIRHISLLINGVESVDCGRVTFRAGTEVTFHANRECTLTPLPLVTNTASYTLPANIYAYAWIVDDFLVSDTGTSERYYADGPDDLYWKNNEHRQSNITFEAVEHSRRDLVGIKIWTKRSNPCGYYPMNNAVGCEVTAKNKFVATYDPELNPDLPPGEYSGIAKIKGEKWGGGKESMFYLNIEITKSNPTTRDRRREEF